VSGEKTAEQRIAEAQERRAKKHAEQKSAATDQFAKDIEALEVLEEEHGRIASVKVESFRPGLPTRVFIRTPKPAEYKRYRDMVEKAVKKDTKRSEVGDQLARACWVYPGSKDEQDQMLEASPGLLVSILLQATALAEGAAVDEGKD
jgi:hypothetical protein